MEKETKEIKKIIKSPEFKILYDLDLIDTIALRNFFIRNEYFELIRGKRNKSQYIQRLADKYNISVQAIKKILYYKYRRKKIDFSHLLPKEY